MGPPQRHLHPQRLSQHALPSMHIPVPLLNSPSLLPISTFMHILGHSSSHDFPKSSFRKQSVNMSVKSHRPSPRLFRPAISCTALTLYAKTSNATPTTHRDTRACSPPAALAQDSTASAAIGRRWKRGRKATQPAGATSMANTQT